MLNTSVTTYLMPFTKIPVNYEPNTKTAGRGSSPFQVVIRSPILAAVTFSCATEAPNCLSQSPVVSLCECLRLPEFADIPN